VLFCRHFCCHGHLDCHTRLEITVAITTETIVHNVVCNQVCQPAQVLKNKCSMVAAADTVPACCLRDIAHRTRHRPHCQGMSLTQCKHGNPFLFQVPPNNRNEAIPGGQYCHGTGMEAAYLVSPEGDFCAESCIQHQPRQSMSLLRQQPQISLATALLTFTRPRTHLLLPGGTKLFSGQSNLT
jgi:hypothetical protein